ncbi:uncharacterized protein LOC133405194 [Phycodurus eques]|uniref:uncharacterized protein LOC133405194 n=1 Tax=Phycodurus eques TaxID=693459 RepID=UPI002ACE3482|nr:uncharacterized protein LOC133405194 [Phycodurus eques]
MWFQRNPTITVTKTQQEATGPTETMILHFISLVFAFSFKTCGTATFSHADSIIEVTTGEIKGNSPHIQLPTVSYNKKSRNITEAIKVAQVTTASFITFLETNSSSGMTNITKVIKSTVSPVPKRSTQSQDKEQTVPPSTTEITHLSTDSNLLSHATQDKEQTVPPSTTEITHLSTDSNLLSHATTFPDNKPTNTDGDTTQFTGSNKPSIFIVITKPNKIQEPPKEKSNNVPIHSQVVAGLIGVALLSMVVGILVIFVKKRKLQRQQITTNDWAGPSPFLIHGDDNGRVTMRSSNQISLPSFLSQRISNRLSFLPEIQEESEAITPGSTFGSTHGGITSEQEFDNKSALESTHTKKIDNSAIVTSSMKPSTTNGSTANENRN